MAVTPLFWMTAGFAFHRSPFTEQRRRHQRENLNNRMRSSSSLQESLSSSSVGVVPIDIDAYLSEVEAALEGMGRTLQCPFTESDRKPMIAALLNLTYIDFKGRIRDQSDTLAYERRMEFLTNHFVPSLEREGISVEDEDSSQPWTNRVLDGLREITSHKHKPSAKSFSRLATGRKYRGNLTTMVMDLTPSLLPLYEKAIETVEETEAIRSVLQEFQVQELDEDVLAAAERCLVMVPPRDAPPPTNNGARSARRGIASEKRCIAYLRETLQQEASNASKETNEETFVILENVKVRGSASKKTHQRRKDDKPYFVTSVDGFGLSTEFDAVVLERTKRPTRALAPDDVAKNDDQCYVLRQVWEAKATIHSESLHDAMSKKLASLRHILSDESSFLSYGDTSIPFSIHTESECEGERKPPVPPILFGIFGNTVMPPHIAAKQIVNVCCSYTLGKDVNRILSTIDSGYCVFETSTVISYLEKQRSLINQTKDFDIVVLHQK